MSLIEFGATAEPPDQPEDDPIPARRQTRPTGMGTSGNPTSTKPVYTGAHRLSHGLQPGEKPGKFADYDKYRHPHEEFLRAGGLDREMTADDVLDAYRAALQGKGERYMSTVNRMGSAAGMPHIKRPQTPGMESDARKVVNFLLDSSDEEAASMVEEAKKKAAKGRMVAKSPGTIQYKKK